MVDGTQGTGAPEMRFFLPQGPALPPKRWQRRWKPGIRIGSIIVGTVLLIAALAAIVTGVVGSLSFTARGVVQVDCTTRTKPFARGVGALAPVRIVDADTGEVYGRGRLDETATLSSGVCLLGFEIDDVRRTDLYTLQIGEDYRVLVSYQSLASGALID
ncbi:hypothetical protein [Gordonia shandongensis]|uniref:hypothetical protein n=1 Tax=Gordonia shandongensis TaxID=376351 RepID=UPI000421A384|nr:hypothetical protein [Gordonia shandongensis]